MTNVPLAAETLTSIGGWPITNAMVNTWLVLGFFLITAVFVRFGLKEIPGRAQAAIELLIEAILSFFDRVTGDRALSRRFLPIAGTMFLFILLSNWLGLLPGTGSIGIWEILHGEEELVPILRPANSDLNLTLALSLISVVGTHLVGIVTLGFWTHAGKYLQFAGIGRALLSLNPIKLLTALVEFLVGLIEACGEIAKIASLALRLFGNIFAGEVLMTVMSSLLAYVVPLPFMGLELIVGLVQAVVFSVLTLVYLTLATAAPHGHESSHEPHEARVGAH